MGSAIMALLVWNLKQLHAILLALRAVCLGGPQTRPWPDTSCKSGPLSPDKIGSSKCKCKCKCKSARVHTARLGLVASVALWIRQPVVLIASISGSISCSPTSTYTGP